MSKKWLIAALAVLCYEVEAQSPFKNIKLNEQTDGDYVMVDPSIVINPKNAKNIVAASASNNIYVSNTGGLSWQKIRIESSFGIGEGQSLVVDPKGKLFFFHSSDSVAVSNAEPVRKYDRLVVQESEDGGFTWTTGEGIGLNPPKHQLRALPVTDTKGNLYIAWTQYDKHADTNSNCLSSIMFSKSKSGSRWSEPVQLSQTPGDCSDNDNTAAGAMPAVAFDGKVFIAWSNQQKIYFDRSYDGGSMWLHNDLVIAEQRGGSRIAIPGHGEVENLPIASVNNSKTFFRGHVYLLWADQAKGEHDTDIMFIRSANSGDYWTQPLRVNDDGVGKHQYAPSMTVDQGTGAIYLVYFDRRAYNDLQSDVYVAYSVDNGSSFVNVKISESAFVPSPTPGTGGLTGISAHNGVITPIWTRNDNGKTSIWTSIISHEELVKAAKDGTLAK